MRPFRDHPGPADTAIPGPISQPLAAERSPLAGIPVYSGQFSVEVHQHRDTVRVAPIGELDLATGPALRGQLNALTDLGFPSIVLDLRGLEFIDVTGLNLIVSFARRARNRELHFEIIQGSPRTQRLFEISGLLAKLPFRAGTPAEHLYRGHDKPSAPASGQHR